jgi:transcriptional regulator with XRE-family HTH domain
VTFRIGGEIMNGKLFSSNLVRTRKNSGMTILQLSEKSHLSKATIINYEKGRRVPRINDVQ